MRGNCRGFTREIGGGTDVNRGPGEKLIRAVFRSSLRSLSAVSQAARIASSMAALREVDIGRQSPGPHGTEDSLPFGRETPHQLDPRASVLRIISGPCSQASNNHTRLSTGGGCGCPLARAIGLSAATSFAGGSDAAAKLLSGWSPRHAPFPLSCRRCVDRPRYARLRRSPCPR